MNTNNKEGLIEEANQLLEETANYKEQYSNERKLIFYLMENLENNQNNILLSNALAMFKRVIALENYKPILSQLYAIANEQIRRNDNEFSKDTIKLFQIQDKIHKTYTFLLRENAQKYIKSHNTEFENNVSISIIASNIVDFKNLLNEIRDIFI